MRPENDLVTNELIWNGLQSLTDEMSVVLYRSSFSPIIREMLDFSCSVLSADGRLLADSGHTPAQIGTLEQALQGLLKKHGVLNPGDMAVTNDPYSGATHLNDVEIFTPVYSGGHLIAYTATVAHHMDVGGMAPGNIGTRVEGQPLRVDIYEEGFQFAGIKLFEAGVRNEAAWDILMANIRHPDASLGDYSAQVSACARGAQRIAELCEKYTEDVVLNAISELLEDTAQRAKREIGSWADSSTTVIHELDGDGLNFERPVRVQASVSVHGGRVSVDFTGSDPQVPGPINVPYASTYAGVYYGLRCFMGNEIRNNSGYMSLIDINAPLGCVVNPTKPAPVKSRHRVVQVIADLMYRAMADMYPDRAVGSSHVSYPIFHMSALDERTGKMTAMMDMIGGGGGARRGAHGDDAIDSYTSNCAVLSAETIEVDYPWRVVRSELVMGSEGAGQWRGGRGLRREYELLGETARGRAQSEQQLGRGPAGAAGGQDGAPASNYLKRQGGEWHRLPQSGDPISMRRGDVIAVVGAGGGGYGPAGESGDR